MAHVRPTPLVPTFRHYIEIRGFRLKAEHNSTPGLMACTYIYIYMCVCVCVCVCKGKVHPVTGHEGPEGE